MRNSTVSDLEVTRLVGLLQQDKSAEAELQARRLRDSYPEAGILWKILGVAMVRQGKDALAELRRTTELMPQDAEAHGNLGSALLKRGRFRLALDALQRSLELDPNNAAAWQDAGDALKSLGSVRESVKLYQRSLGIEPRNADALNSMGNALLALKEVEGALGCYQAALKLEPVHAQLHANIANALAMRAQTDDAIAWYQRALALNPRDVPILNGLGRTLRDAGRRAEAAVVFHGATEINPQEAESFCNLGAVQFELRRVEDAVTSLTRALVLRPNFAQAHLSLGLALRQLRRPEDAERSCKTALAIEPDNAEALNFLGELHADRGQFAEAEQLFRRAIAARPQFAFAYASIATHRKMTEDDAEWLAGAQNILSQQPPLTEEIGLRYALGKYFDDLKQFPNAFENYRVANELTKRYGARYDGDKLSRRIDRIIELFGGRASADGASLDSDAPVLIVGMPRSGTSLAEQILASHPQAFGAGEVVFWNAAFDRFFQNPAAGGGSVAGLREVAHDYVRQLSSLSGGAPRVIDKLPANFLYAGLVHQLLPQARIIHMRRHPLDTCLSIYFQNFFNIGPYANDLHDLAHYYRQYLRITEVWQKNLPASRYLELSYESLIEDQEAATRRVLEFVGLPWDPRCLDFHRTERVVITASKWQVRQRISSSSVGRWRHYESFLGPLLSLQDEGAS